jgi:hypothetical protein
VVQKNVPPSKLYVVFKQYLFNSLQLIRLETSVSRVKAVEGSTRYYYLFNERMLLFCWLQCSTFPMMSLLFVRCFIDNEEKRKRLTLNCVKALFIVVKFRWLLGKVGEVSHIDESYGI